MTRQQDTNTSGAIPTLKILVCTSGMFPFVNQNRFNWNTKGQIRWTYFLVSPRAFFMSLTIRLLRIGAAMLPSKAVISPEASTMSFARSVIL